MRQNIAPLCHALINAQHKVQIETAGSFWLDAWPDNLKTARYDIDIIVSPKTALINSFIRDNAEGWKYIISCAASFDPHDGLPIYDTQSLTRPYARPLAKPPHGFPPSRVYLQPMDEEDAAKNYANRGLCAEIAKKRGYRVSLQVHKILGVP